MWPALLFAHILHIYFKYRRSGVCMYVCARLQLALELDVCMYARGKNVLMVDVDIHTSGRYRNPGG